MKRKDFLTSDEFELGGSEGRGLEITECASREREEGARTAAVVLG